MVINIDAVNTIYSVLNRVILSRYKLGAKNIIAMASKDYKKGKFTLSDIKSKWEFDDESKLFKIKWNKDDLQAVRNFKIESFAVANVGDYELNEKLKDLYLKLKDDRNAFDLEARKMMLDYGIGLEDQMPSGWLESQMITAELRSYSSARWIKANDPDISDMYPAVKTHTRGDSKVRASHVQMYEDKIYMKNDPNLPAILPPALGEYRCRCSWQPVPVWEIEGKNIPKINKGEYEKNLDFENVVNPTDIKSIYQGYLKTKFKELSDDAIKQIRENIKRFAQQLDVKDIEAELNKIK